VRRIFLVLGRVAANRIPGFRSWLKYIWMPLGSLLFMLAYRNACKRSEVRLHIGAGSVRLDGWLNTDILPHLSALFLDATRRFPIRDNTVSYIFSEHFIEHMPRRSAISFLKECFRVLKPGGMLRVSTPDAEALAKAYLNRSEQARLLNERNRKLSYQYSTHPIDILNTAFKEDFHFCLYDAETLQRLLDSAGFCNMTRCKVSKSIHPELSGIEHHYIGSIEDDFTLIMEATKPHSDGDTTR